MDEVFPGDLDPSKLPIEFNRYTDTFEVDAPNGETYHFRDYELTLIHI